MASSVQQALATCGSAQPVICAAGSGAGGWNTAGCQYSASYAVSVTGPLGAQTSTDPVLCVTDPQTLAINSAISVCSSECYGIPGDYFGCYCSCKESLDDLHAQL